MSIRAWNPQVQMQASAEQAADFNLCQVLWIYRINSNIRDAKCPCLVRGYTLTRA